MNILTTLIFLLSLAALAWPESALAAQVQTQPAWRVWWDEAWRILNFLVLAVLIYKLAKQPLKEFLRGQRDVVTMDLNKLKKAKEEAIAERRTIEEKTKNLAEELADYEGHMTALAAKQRDAIIEDAKREGELILERAQQWAGQNLRQARAQLTVEILDMAADIASEKVRQNITSDDKAKMVDDFTSQVEQTRPA